jgi:acyl-CoA synthetase (AMP-forming)/AMP-acid ligase II
VVCNRDTTTVDVLRTSARRLLSSFKVPTVWLLLVSDDDVPRGSTGKVDVRRLRELLDDIGFRDLIQFHSRAERPEKEFE